MAEKSYLMLRTIWLEGLGQTPIGEITPDQITDHLEKLAKERGYSKSTWNAALSNLSGFFRWAKSRGLVEENPVSEGRVPRIPKGKIQNERRLVIKPAAVQATP